MTPIVARAIERLRADARQPLEAASLMLMIAAIDDSVERFERNVPVTEGRICEVLLDAAAALEDEYNNKAR